MYERASICIHCRVLRDRSFELLKPRRALVAVVIGCALRVLRQLHHTQRTQYLHHRCEGGFESQQVAEQWKRWEHRAVPLRER